jgi:hypothetical protein
MKHSFEIGRKIGRTGRLKGHHFFFVIPAQAGIHLAAAR